MSTTTTTTTTGLYAGAAAPTSAQEVIAPPAELLNALNALAGAGYQGIFDTNRAILPEAKASFYLSKVGEVTVVAPATRGTSSQLALAAATIGMAGAIGATLAYNTSFAKGRGSQGEGIIPGVYGLVLLSGPQDEVKDLVRRIEEDRAEAGRSRRATPAATPATPAASNVL
jgi:hypothetical protein